MTAACVLLVFFPRHYVSRTQLAPQDSSGGLSGALAQSGALVTLSELVGNREPIEADLDVARSNAVLALTAVTLGMAHQQDAQALRRAELRLKHKIDVQALRGNLLQIEVKDADARQAKRIVVAMEAAIQTRLADIVLDQNAQREKVAQNRMDAAQTGLSHAQDALRDFQLRNKIASPSAQLSVGIGVLATLQGEYDAKQVELHSLEQFATSNNIQVTTLRAQLQAIQSQIERARTTASGSPGPTLQALTTEAPEYFNLVRDVSFQESLVQVYSKYLEETKIDSLSAGSTVTEVEPPYVDPARQYNTLGIGVLIVSILMIVLSEFYFWRPPVGHS